MWTLRRLLLELIFTRWNYRVLILLVSCLSAIFGVLGPFFQKEFIDLLTHSPLYLHRIWPDLMAKAHSPFLFLFLTFLCLLLSLSLSQLVNYLGQREAIYLQRMWAQRLYDHILTLRTDSLNGRPVGEIVAIYTTDIPGATILLEQSLPQGTSIVFPLILAPLALVVLFQLPLWPTLSLIGLIVLLSFALAFRQSKFFFIFKRLAADRIGLVTEWIQNIRTLRILGWVRQFEEHMHQVREIETENRIQMVSNGQTMNAMASSITFLLNVAAIATLLYLSGQAVTPGVLLALLWIVAVFLVRPFRQLPWFFTFVFDAWTSLKRVSEVMSLRNEDVHARNQEFTKLRGLGVPDPALQIKNLSLNIHGKNILQDISFTVGLGEWVAIVGEVGAGKTMLLLSLLGETGANFESYKIGDNDAGKLPLDQLRQFFTFVPQEGFIMSGSLRENVGLEYDIATDNDATILQSLSRAQFDWKMERLSEGLDTEIGERGVNLSGGQKQRVSLARVDYYQSPVVLLDDCLSAVDVDTEEKLVNGLLQGAWKHRTRILVTHRLTVLEKVDRILFLVKGRLRSVGTYEELLQQDPIFREYTASITREEGTSWRKPPI